MVPNNNVIDFNGILLNIERVDEENFFINVSGVARKFGKNITDWRNSKGTKEYINELEKSNALKASLINTEIIGKTMIHSSLLVHFARFISPKFAVWADKLVYDYITGNLKKEIAKLKAEKMLAKIDDDGYTSVRGLSQRTKFSETEIREFAVDFGLIKKDIRDTMFWGVNDTKNGLVKANSKHGTPYFNMNRIVNLLEQYYDREEFMEEVE